MTGLAAVLAIVVSLVSIAAGISAGIRALVRRIQRTARRDKELEDMATAVKESGRTAGQMRSETVALQARVIQLEAHRHGILNELNAVQRDLERLRRELGEVKRTLAPRS